MINSINDDNKCFSYAATVALNHEEIEKKKKNCKEYKTLSVLHK